MEYNKKDFFIIFDTNTLFHSYDKRGDFTSFYFNKTFDNIVEMVAKLDIYSIEHQIMIPFIMDEENQCIHLKTMLEFKDEDARKSRYISNPRHDQLNGCCSLNKFDYNLRNNKDISIYLLPEVFEYKLRLLKVLFQKKY